MGKKRYYEQRRSRITRKRIVTYGIVAAVVSLISYLGYSSTIPVNGTTPVFGAPVNHFIKAMHSPVSGYNWLSIASAKVKGIRSSGGGGNAINPEYVFNKGELETFHVINEDYTTKSNHNFNLDEFNVHTKDLAYYETQTITFVADKTGTFEYYCTIHPEMKGNITIE
jgi:hypothetical protein